MKEIVKDIINYAAKLIALGCGLGGLVWSGLALYTYNASQNCIKSGRYSWTEMINMFNRASELEKASYQAGNLGVILIMVSLIGGLIYILTKNNEESLKEEA